MASTRSEAKLEVLEKAMSVVQGDVDGIHGRIDSITQALANLAESQARMEANQLRVEQWMNNLRGNSRRGGLNVEHIDEEDETRGSYRESRLTGDEELRYALKRVEMPGFDGTDPRGWLGRAEQYFELHDTPVAHRLKLAQIHMDGLTYHWFQWLRLKVPDLTWGRLAEELIKRYGGRRQENPFFLLASLKQGQQTLDAYIEQFEVLLAQVGDLPEEQCLGYFLSGLREEIGKKISIHEPRTTMRAMDLARAIDEEMNGYWGSFREGQTTMGISRNWRNNTSSDRHDKPEVVNWEKGRYNPMNNSNTRREQYGYGTDRRSNNNPAGNNQKTEGGTNIQGQQQRKVEPKRDNRIVSQQEFLRRKEKGLCFKCGEVYSPMHKCAFKLMQVALKDQEMGEERDSEPLETGEDGNELEVEIKEYGTLELPCFSIGGVTQPQTMKLKGKIQDVDVVVMVDSGASHNFISRTLVEKLDIQIDESVHFGVCLGDGTKVQCQGVCRGLKVQLENYAVNITGHMFELGGVDVILGVDCLRINWNKMHMRFREGEQLVELKGDPSLQRAIVSLKSICKVTEVEYAVTFMLCQQGPTRR
ncbi:hypothetical protein F511_37858 [Dorcoceras hygrometricum]|uniref:Retrotransposon gag domain-containing protein n=1 Tax=Dorcoceras hygrometricum TaxID=472368 RepID=A0A2Z7B0M4_9LAMI|nr:hypothetical protein F511_37858 [Dorcoceras hygrometricum]